MARAAGAGAANAAAVLTVPPVGQPHLPVVTRRRPPPESRYRCCRGVCAWHTPPAWCTRAPPAALWVSRHTSGACPPRHGTSKEGGGNAGRRGRWQFPLPTHGRHPCRRSPRGTTGGEQRGVGRPRLTGAGSGRRGCQADGNLAGSSHGSAGRGRRSGWVLAALVQNDAPPRVLAEWCHLPVRRIGLEAHRVCSNGEEPLAVIPAPSESPPELHGGGRVDQRKRRAHQIQIRCVPDYSSLACSRVL